MAKYKALQNYLNSLKRNCWKASFSEIEDIIGAELPASARKYRQWWANDKQNGRHWLEIGWRTRDVDFENETVLFFR